MLYWLKLILIKGSPFFKKKSYPYRSTSHKHLQKQKNKDFFIQLLCSWPHLTNNNLPAPISIEEILDQLIFLNPHSRLDIEHPTQKYFRKFTIISVLCRFLERGLISSNIFCKKPDLSAANHKRCINLLWAQFPMIGKTYLKLKVLKNSF